MVIPTYNRRDWLEGALASAIKKEWADLVVIIVDDGSTDDTAEFLKLAENDFSTTNKKFVHLHHEKNTNIASALNTGIEQAIEMGAEYIEWMSDDDRHWPHKTSMEIQVFRNPPLKKLGLVYSGYLALWVEGPPEKGFPIQRTVTAIPTYFPDRRAQWEAINKLCIINGSTTMIATEVFKDVGYFDPKWMCAQDFEFFIRLQRSFNTFRLPQVLCNRYEHPKTLTNFVDVNKLNEDNKLFEYVKNWEPDIIE